MQMYVSVLTATHKEVQEDHQICCIHIEKIEYILKVFDLLLLGWSRLFEAT